MLAPIIPIDPTDRALAQIVHLLPLQTTAALDSSFQLEPVARVMTLMNVITEAAKSNQKVVEILRQDGLVPTLRQLVATRQSEQAAAEQPTDQVRAA